MTILGMNYLNSQKRITKTTKPFFWFALFALLVHVVFIVSINYILIIEDPDVLLVLSSVYMCYVVLLILLCLLFLTALVLSIAFREIPMRVLINHYFWGTIVILGMFYFTIRFFSELGLYILILD
jgi:hypothetical protein